MMPSTRSRLRQRCDTDPAVGVVNGGLVAGPAAWWSAWAVCSAFVMPETACDSTGSAPAGVNSDLLAVSGPGSSAVSMFALLHQNREVERQFLVVETLDLNRHHA